MSYATIDELKTFGINPDALTGIDDPRLQAALDAASGVADGYLASRFTLPLTGTIPVDLKQRVCDMAAWFALKARGINPESNESVKDGYDQAIAWLRDVSRGLVKPQVTDSPVETITNAQTRTPIILSNPKRNW